MRWCTMTQLMSLFSVSGIRVFMIFRLNTFDVQRKLFYSATYFFPYFLFLYTSLILVSHAKGGTNRSIQHLH